MSVRDEMKAKLHEGCAYCWMASKGRIRAVSCARCEGAIDALMPIVERVAREAGAAGWQAGMAEAHLGETASLDDIVRRVCG